VSHRALLATCQLPLRPQPMRHAVCCMSCWGWSLDEILNRMITLGYYDALDRKHLVNCGLLGCAAEECRLFRNMLRAGLRCTNERQRSSGAPHSVRNTRETQWSSRLDAINSPDRAPCHAPPSSAFSGVPLCTLPYLELACLLAVERALLGAPEAQRDRMALHTPERNQGMGGTQEMFVREYTVVTASTRPRVRSPHLHTTNTRAQSTHRHTCNAGERRNACAHAHAQRNAHEQEYEKKRAHTRAREPTDDFTHIRMHAQTHGCMHARSHARTPAQMQARRKRWTSFAQTRSCDSLGSSTPTASRQLNCAASARLATNCANAYLRFMHVNEEELCSCAQNTDRHGDGAKTGGHESGSEEPQRAGALAVATVAADPFIWPQHPKGGCRQQSQIPAGGTRRHVVLHKRRFGIMFVSPIQGAHLSLYVW
jgi:hypothetical protein